VNSHPDLQKERVIISWVKTQEPSVNAEVKELLLFSLSLQKEQQKLEKEKWVWKKIFEKEK
jgi:hypothetical protein